MKRHFIVAGASALCMALAPTMAFGTETSSPLPILEQTNSAPANATAGNANTSGQLIGQSGGDSQSAEQTAVNTQVIPIAAAPATTVQTLPVNLNLPIRLASPGNDGAVSQSNSAPATAEATNANTSRQLIEQQGGGNHSKKDGSGQTARQTAVNTQVIPIALAPATSVQTLPINANIPVRIASPGDNGSVNQSNKAPSDASASNLNGSKQAIGQHGGYGGSQSASQTAINTQLLPIALAPATSVQTLPINVNVPVRFLSPGADGSVKQSNRAPATAEATNHNGSFQAIGQGPGKKGHGYGPQSARQKAINTQLIPIAFAPATSAQTAPLNVNAPIRLLDELPRLPVDPFAVLADPVKTVGGALPVNPLGLLASPTDALGALPLGAVTGLLPALPLGAVTGLLGGLPLGAVTGLLPPLPVGLI